MKNAHYQTVQNALRHALESETPVQLRVTSHSMAPLIQQGDAVRVEAVPRHGPRRGDIVVIKTGRDLLTHRLVQMGASQWYTKGDNCAAPDAPVPPARVLGRVTALIREDREISLQTRGWQRYNSWLGWLSWLEGRSAHNPLRQRLFHRLFRLSVCAVAALAHTILPKPNR